MKKMYKVLFNDAVTGVPRGIKIYAFNPYEACMKAKAIRNGVGFRAKQVNSDEEYVTIPVC